MDANQTLSITIMRFIFSCGAFSIITLSICFFGRGNFEKNSSHAGAVYEGLCGYNRHLTTNIYTEADVWPASTDLLYLWTYIYVCRCSIRLL